MAASDPVSEARNILREGDVAYRNSVSEAFANRLAQTLNFISNRQYDTHQFNFNGRYALGVSVLGADGIFPILFDMEIVGVSMFNRRSGASGTTEIDIQWLDTSNSNQGSIFSTTPKIDSTSSDYTYLIRRNVDSTDLEAPTGATLPVLSKTNFDAGDALFCEIASAMSDAEDCALLIHFRPR